MNIVDYIQEVVDRIVKEKYKDDTCMPQFIVSVLQEIDYSGKINNHKLLLTVIHNGISNTRVIFPILSYNYGYENLEKEIEWLYNSTM